jgi:hypothetical protein
MSGTGHQKEIFQEEDQGGNSSWGKTETGTADDKPQSRGQGRTMVRSPSLIKYTGICKIWDFHGGDYEEWRILGCYAVWLLQEPPFRRNLATSFVRVTRIGELGTTLAVASNRRTLRRNTKLALGRATLRNIPEAALFQIHKFSCLAFNIVSSSRPLSWFTCKLRLTELLLYLSTAR